MIASGSRVCFAATELLGTVHSGGIATATTHAALVLGRNGCHVTLVDCGGAGPLDGDWVERYRTAGVMLRSLDRSRAVHPPFVADSYRLYHQLRGERYDAIVFQDWQGLGYCSMSAKRAGLAFADTSLIQWCHGPNEWLQEANRRLAFDTAELGLAHIERRGSELADTVVSPSRHLLDWMRAAGWGLPPDQRVVPYFTEGHTIDIGRTPDADEHRETRAPSEALRRLVFFGRLEERKGVRMFVEALDLLGPQLLRGVGVTYLGREATLDRHDVNARLDPRVGEALADVTFRTDLDQLGARALLREPGTLVVIPSYLDNSPNVVYECIEDQIPFLASDAGGIGELIAEVDRKRTLFPPSAPMLASALRPLLAERRVPSPPAAAFSGAASLDAWRSVLTRPAGSRRDDDPDVRLRGSTGVDDDELPLVSVIVPHFNQPVLVRDALGSIGAQDYPRLEIVVVDDGSTDPDAISALDALEEHDWGRPLKLVRQENRYLGAARNAGVEHATGDLVAFVDDDDLVEVSYVRSLVVAQRAFDADAVTTAISGVAADESGVIMSVSAEAVWVFLGDAPDLGTALNVFGGAAALYRRDALAGVGGFHTRRGVGHEDWDVLARMSLAGHRVVSIPEPLYTYRVRPGSMLRTTAAWSNMQPVFATYRAQLPPTLRTWPALVRGQQDLVDELRAECAELRAQTQQHERYVSVARRLVPPRARGVARALLRRLG